MNRLSAFAAIAVVSALATPVVVSATAISPKEPAVTAQQVALAKIDAAPSTATAEAPCMRRVRVVYPGAGVTNGVACAAASLELRR